MKNLFILLFLPVICLSQNKKYTSETKADEIIHLSKKNKKRNHPDNLNAYQYYTYNKYYIDDYKNYLQSDSIPSQSDQLLFLGENITKVKYSRKYGKKNTIIASKVSGLSESFYELFNEKIFENDFPEVIKNSDLYNFRLLDSISTPEKIYIINFSSKKNLLLNGSRGLLHIDASDYSLIKYSGEEYRSMYTRSFEIDWERFKTIRYLKNKTSKIKFTSVDLSAYLSKEMREHTFIITPLIIIKTDISGFSEYENPKNSFKGYSYELDKNVNVNTENKISRFRTDSLNFREKQTYTHHYFTDLFSVEKKINSYFTLKKGELMLGGFSLDLPNLIGFNDQEGFRFQLGGKTNYKFNTNYSLHGYTAIGTKDGKFKAGGGIDFFVNKKYDGKLSLKGSSDVNPASKNIVRELQSFGQTQENLNYMYNNIFYSYEKGEISYQQDFLKKFTAIFSTSYQTQKSNFEYSYNQQNLDHHFRLFSNEVQVKYAPYAKYMMTYKGKITLEDKPLHFYFTYLKGWKSLDADFDFHKFDFSADISFNNTLGKSKLLINSGYISGKTVLWNLYGSFGNAKIRNSITKKFSPKGSSSFETMAPGEFFADKYLSFYLTHHFKDVNISPSKKIHISVVYNSMIGNLEHKNLHSLYSFKIPKKLYQEAGIEFNKLISDLGLGFYYRFGAYSLGRFEQDFFIKLTFSAL